MRIYNFLEATANFNLPPQEAIKHFRDKGLKTSFDWRDVLGEEHDAAFTVAKMMDTDMLSAVRAALDDHLVRGGTFSDFKKTLIPELKAAGWWGKRDVIDPLTGRVVSAQLGSASRLETIFRSNLQSAYSVGRWDMIQKNASTAPFLMYDAVDDDRTRRAHAAIDNTVLPVTSSFWDEFMPPNGFNCRCGVVQLDSAELKEYGLTVSKSPVIARKTWTNPRTQKKITVPDGVDPGWNINPGQRRLEQLGILRREKEQALSPADRKQVEKTPTALPPDLQEPLFKAYEAQKTVTAAADFFYENNYADAVDFGKLTPEVVNSIGESLSEHLVKFPELRQSVGFIGSIQAKYAVVYQREYAHYYRRAIELYPDRDPGALAKRWATRKKASGEWAHAMARTEHQFYKGLHGVAFNEKFGAKAGMESFHAGLKRSVETGFHPPATDTIRSIMDHELGHSLDFLLDIRTRADVIALWKNWDGDSGTLSRYAKTNIQEFIAEAWAEYINNPSPRSIAKTIGDIIEKAYAEKFG